MSQPKVRKGAGGDGAGRGRGTAPRASAPAAILNTSRPREQSQQSRSKNNIPKSVRYDLENALVSLCDVWFEDIKPHLVRNKIKLHVSEGGAGAASGDHVPNAGCSHLDPGAASDRRPQRDANCAGYYSTQPTASRVQCRRPQAPSCNQLLLHSSPLETLDHPPNYENQTPKRPRTRRKHKTAQELSPGSRVPRLCRTHSIVSSPRPAPWNAARRIPYQEPCLSTSPPYDDCYFQFTMSRIKAKIQTKATQTESPSKRRFVSVGCQSSPSLLNLRRIRRPSALRHSRPASPLHLSRHAEVSMQREVTFVRFPNPVKSATLHRNNSNLKSHSQALPVLQRPKSPPLNMRRASISPVRRYHVEGVPDGMCDTKTIDIPIKAITDKCVRKPATTTLFPSRRAKLPQPAVVAQEPILFQDDLVNIIGEKHDKRLRILFKKVESEDSASSLNLPPTPRDHTKLVHDLSKPPWK